MHGVQKSLKESSSDVVALGASLGTSQQPCVHSDAPGRPRKEEVVAMKSRLCYRSQCNLLGKIAN